MDMVRSCQAFFDEMRQGIQQENTNVPIVHTQKKVGRNEPCPCGSGKKYKKCCYDLHQSKPISTIARLEDKFDLLEWYPKNSELFEETYSADARNIDMLVYKALSHRAIPLWIKRDYEQERIGKIHYLNDALGLFLEKCRKEQIMSFSAYDEKYMVHYRSEEWVFDLIDLIENNDEREILSIKIQAEETFQAGYG
jgi:hypothetical protein